MFTAAKKIVVMKTDFVESFRTDNKCFKTKRLSTVTYINYA